MTRFAIETLMGLLDAAYLGDPYHALRRNIESVAPEEWSVRPAEPSVGPDGVFGPDPDLAIADLVAHVATAKVMWANRAFGDGTLQWATIVAPGRDPAALLGWLDAAHRAIVEGLAGLESDAQLDAQRMAPWGEPLRISQMLALAINHDVYHAGEINRQRGLIRGSTGWER